jgi:Oxygenase domain of the 2OGFeDO superfamily
LKMTQDPPQACAVFKRPGAMEWLDAISQSNSILSAILAVIHPELHDAGKETFNRLRQHASIERQDVLHQWTSAFSGVSVIFNRLTPPHRDLKSRRHWYDLLVTLGCYRDCDFKLPGLGFSLEYGPGTVIGLGGMMLEHEVPHFGGESPERVCYAYFMRDRVHEWAKVPGRSWMTMSHYQ